MLYAQVHRVFTAVFFLNTNLAGRALQVMAMLTNPKLQKAMEVQMSQGADALAKLLSKDPESRELLLKLNAALQQK